jgi:hypothetical protein
VAVAIPIVPINVKAKKRLFFIISQPDRSILAKDFPKINPFSNLRNFLKPDKK